jgi:transcriptional regulator with XRE-family HTH domain
LPGITHSKAHKALVAVLIGLRKQAGLEQADLAKRCKWKRQTISQIETGIRGVQVAELPILAKALRVPELTLYKRWLAFRSD